MVLALVLAQAVAADAAPRPRIRDWGVRIGILESGPLNAITDVAGVRGGHATVVRGEPLPSVNTGVTVGLPHAGNVFREKVAAAVVGGNAFGKLAGELEINELCALVTPTVL